MDRTGLVCKINSRPTYLPTERNEGEEEEELYEVFFRLISY